MTVNPIYSKRYRHTPTPILGIGGNTFADLSKYSNWDMARIDDEICLALAMNNITDMPMVGGQIPPEMREQWRDRPFEEEYLDQLDDPAIKQIIHGMSINQRRKYLLFKDRIISPWFFVFSLKPNKFATKSRDLHAWHGFVNDMMPYTKQCLESLPFKEIGRAVIYGSWPNAAVPCHRDDVPMQHTDHHININPGVARPIYIYDSLAQEKIYLPNHVRCYAYNVRDYHGVDPVPLFTYTLRVDGIYTDQLCAEIGLDRDFIGSNLYDDI